MSDPVRRIAARLKAIDWADLEQRLNDTGCARLPVVLTPEECASVVAQYDDDRLFRKRIDMARHRFGAGEYKYFAAPLPPLVRALRAAAYPPLAQVANRWRAALASSTRTKAASFPADLESFLRRCARKGQTKTTPLVLRYEAGGFNCLHQDLYGEIAFPLQMTFLLSRPEIDFAGGEMLFIENRPREQSRGTALALKQGEGVVFTTRERPVAGKRGYRRVVMRHGVSQITSGLRYTLGIIFHDAR